MRGKSRSFYLILSLILLTFIISGCTVTIQKGRRSDIEKIESLTKEIEGLNARLDQLQEEKQDEISELEKAKLLLEKKLSKEIGDKDVRLEMAERGLAIIFLAEVLFDSGKADLKEEVLPAYFDRPQGLIYSPRWVQMMKASIRDIAHNFNMDRMLIEYIEKMYLPAAKASSRAAEYQRAHAAAAS